ncbi:glycogenin-1 isoform X2 [Patella vulgata]|uniref:glycogenin-1 isoform X2 n=1 Tax=Patella vulgata TaxID=6465 RepID=UPI00217F9F96|nr:glycogenin-1 isoform X2 [Patella vulgata]
MGDRAEREAFVTLATNDTYALGCLVLGNSLRRTSTKRKIVVMVTSGVTSSMRDQLQQVFDLVHEVDLLDSRDSANLALLGRPDLSCTFTKFHCWRLTQYEKAVFLDADTLVLHNVDELFDHEELSASPDAGWPDCFNSGVFVFKPSEDTYAALINFALAQGSFDGGDQGLLNLFFRDWSTKTIDRHLPFTYNVVSQAFYSYLPAFTQFRNDIRIIHFIGEVKPWNHAYNTKTGKVQMLSDSGHNQDFLQLWWDIFMSCVQVALDPNLFKLLHCTPSLQPSGMVRQLEVCPDTNQNNSSYHVYKILYPYVPPSLDKVYYTPTNNLPLTSNHPQPTFHLHTSANDNMDANLDQASANDNLDTNLDKTSDHNNLDTDEQSSCQCSKESSHIIEIPDSPKNYLLLETHYAEDPISVTDPENSSQVRSEACDLEMLLKHHHTVEDDVGKINQQTFDKESGDHSILDLSRLGGLVGELASLQVMAGRPSIVYMDEVDRKQAWERGQMDYMGVDSFDNIKRKLDSKIVERSPSPVSSRQVINETGETHRSYKYFRAR